LPPKQRAALILCDALDWSAKDAASFLGMSVPAVNSALQRARASLHDDPAERRPEPTKLGTEREREFLDRYVAAHERRDIDALMTLLHEDLRWSMPPQPATYVGRDEVVGEWVSGGFGTAEFGEFRCVVTRANRVPAVAIYLKKPDRAEYVPMAMDVLRIEGDKIREITSFPFDGLREAFGLPKELS
jgi:RNA polymerase sigma-70 factor (ECF subfamily)